MTDSSFEQCSFRQVSFSGSFMVNTSFISAQFRSSRFVDTLFDRACIKGCAGPRIQMETVRFSKSAILEPEISHGVFRSLCALYCSFTAEHPSGVTGIRHSLVSDALFIGCRITGSFFSLSQLENCLFLGCVFQSMDWDAVELRDVTFRDCQGCPSGRGSRLDSAPFGYEDWLSFKKEYLHV